MKQFVIACLLTGCVGAELSDESDRTVDTIDDNLDNNSVEIVDEDQVLATCAGPEVHVFGVYETRSDHGGGNHPVGAAQVLIDRPGRHRLVLSAYEPTAWLVYVAFDAEIESIHLVGYHAQTVEGVNAPITTDDAQTGTFACGYSYPYNGEGCDTDRLLELAKRRAKAFVTTFHGCYRATLWHLRSDGTATSDCATDDGYQQDDASMGCSTTGRWEASASATDARRVKLP